ncbi:MAG: flavodoxin-dependent (E)-4-hydroxy-3-methylbut-2-enyl-diphosphate synthase [Nitrospinae bacterium]|nr:flavodoxin-dependent (E)-4-hydroxy-3-methylbut-2-enyl-diphosphate synthase [Nitrospinota bacterium]
MAKKETKRIYVGGVPIGGGAPVAVQSMGNRNPRDFDAILKQIRDLKEVDCEIVRLAVPDEEAATVFARVKKESLLPLIADIHFDYRLALAAIEAGADGLRLNPGNIGHRDRVEAVVKAAMERKIPIRIGVNAGSIGKEMLAKHGGHPTTEAMVESAMEHVHILEDLNFDLIKISIKASDVPKTVAAYRALSEKVDYPLHVGISEAGTLFSGTIKSSVGVGILLNEGIGDTIRISLTADPVEEVKVAYEILKSLHLRQLTPDIISCPTCGRCEIDLLGMAAKAEEELRKIKKPIKVAIMGCVVNGPGEAREADIGIAGGHGEGLIFKNGKILRKVDEAHLFSALMEEIKKL